MERVPKGGLKITLQPTLESSSIQTTEPIVKCHIILEMGSHDLPPHNFLSDIQFLKRLQKVFFLIGPYFLPRESLIGCNKILCRPLKTFVCVSLRYRKHCGGSVEIVVVVCGRICGNMCGKMDFFLDWNTNLCGSRY